VYFHDITERKLAYQKIEHQIRREKALNRVIQAIRQSLDLETVFATAALEIASLLQTEHINIQRFDPDHQTWTIVAEHRVTPTPPVCSAIPWLTPRNRLPNPSNSSPSSKCPWPATGMAQI
jgi:GAF domain-containing protein